MSPKLSANFEKVAAKMSAIFKKKVAAEMSAIFKINCG